MAVHDQYLSIIERHGWKHLTSSQNAHHFIHPNFPDSRIALGINPGITPNPVWSWTHAVGSSTTPYGVLSRSSNYSNGATPARNLEVYLDKLHAKYPQGANRDQLVRDQFKDKFATPNKQLDEGKNNDILTKYGWEKTKSNSHHLYFHYHHLKFPEHQISVIYPDMTHGFGWDHHNANTFQLYTTKSSPVELEDYLHQLHSKYPEGASHDQMMKDRFASKFVPKNRYYHQIKKDDFLSRFGTKKLQQSPDDISEAWDHGPGSDRKIHAKFLADHDWIKDNDYNGPATPELHLDYYTHSQFPNQRLAIGNRWAHYNDENRSVISSWIADHPKPNNLDSYLTSLHATYPNGAKPAQIMRDRFVNKYKVSK